MPGARGEELWRLHKDDVQDPTPSGFDSGARAELEQCVLGRFDWTSLDHLARRLGFEDRPLLRKRIDAFASLRRRLLDHDELRESRNQKRPRRFELLRPSDCPASFSINSDFDMRFATDLFSSIWGARRDRACRTIVDCS